MSIVDYSKTCDVYFLIIYYNCVIYRFNINMALVAASRRSPTPRRRCSYLQIAISNPNQWWLSFLHLCLFLWPALLPLVATSLLAVVVFISSRSRNFKFQKKIWFQNQ